MLNVFELAQPEEREGAGHYQWFVVEPNAMYPAALDHVRGVVERGVRPPDPLAQEYDRLVDVSEQAWTDAREPAGDLSPARRRQREIVLEGVRRWFTELLQQAVGGPIGLHILKDERWKL